MPIGKIVASNSHTDYLCQVYGPGEVEAPPAADDYAFGQFLRIEAAGGRSLVGIVYDTQLVNPDFGRLGPRLSPASELAVFSPDYLNEKATLAGIAVVGMTDADGEAVQGVPPVAAAPDALVEPMSDDEVCDFHQEGGRLQWTYAPLLLARASPLVLPLLQHVAAHLTELLPDQADLLAVLEDDLAWKAQVAPLGGTA